MNGRPLHGEREAGHKKTFLHGARRKQMEPNPRRDEEPEADKQLQRQIRRMGAKTETTNTNLKQSEFQRTITLETYNRTEGIRNTQQPNNILVMLDLDGTAESSVRINPMRGCRRTCFRSFNASDTFDSCETRSVEIAIFTFKCFFRT